MSEQNNVAGSGGGESIERFMAAEAAQNAALTLGTAFQMIDMLTGGGGNALLLMHGLGVYAELQAKRSAAACGEDDADAKVFNEARELLRASIAARMAEKPPLEPEVVAYAKAHDLADARRALADEKAREAAIVADSSVN